MAPCFWIYKDQLGWQLSTFDGLGLGWEMHECLVVQWMFQSRPQGSSQQTPFTLFYCFYFYIYIYMYFFYFCFPVFRQNPAFSVSLVLVHSVWLWKCALDTPTLQPISLCRIQKLPKLHSLKLLIISPWKWMVGILLSFWEGPFSGAMLVSGRVDLLDDGQNLPNPNLILTSMFVLHLENQTVRNCMNQLYTVIVLFVI